MSVEPLPRVAARVLLLDPDDRVLLFRGPLTGWFTAGGGLLPAETPAEAALREVFEETGLRLAAADLTGPIWADTVDFDFDGVRYHQDQTFYAARTGRTAIDTSGMAESERRQAGEYRWWSAGELASTGDTIWPATLPTLLDELIAAGTV